MPLSPFAEIIFFFHLARSSSVAILVHWLFTIAEGVLLSSATKVGALETESVFFSAAFSPVTATAAAPDGCADLSKNGLFTPFVPLSALFSATVVSLFGEAS